MSTFATSGVDNDQQFDFIGGYYNGWVIKHRSTGKCLNGYNKYEGAELNVSPCNFGHIDQAWHALDKGNGYMILRLSGTNLCVTVDSPVGNSSNVVLRNCLYNVANGTQDWSRSGNINYGNTLPRTGGIGDFILDGIRFGYNTNYRTTINGIAYSYDQYIRMRETLSNYKNMVFDKGVYISIDGEDEHIAFVAPWGFYSRFTSTKAERLADKVGQYGNMGAGLAGFIVGNQINPLLSFPTSFLINRSVSGYQDDIRTCSRTNNQVYVKYELVSGSWANSVLLLPLRGEKVFELRITTSCN